MAEISETETAFFWKQTFINAKHSEAIHLLMCVRQRTSNLLKRFNIRTCLRATNQGSKRPDQRRGSETSKNNSSKKLFEEQIQHLKSRLRERGYPKNLRVQRTFSEVQFENRKLALPLKPKKNKRILPFVAQYHPPVQNFEKILMKD